MVSYWSFGLFNSKQRETPLENSSYFKVFKIIVQIIEVVYVINKLMGKENLYACTVYYFNTKVAKLESFV